MKETIPVAVVGASGYSGEELVRLLLGHPRARLSAITSRRYSGTPLIEVFPRFAHLPAAQGLAFSKPDPERLAQEAAVALLALPHGASAEIAVPLLEAGCRVIDLSADFRLRDPDTYLEYYGSEHPAPQWTSRAVYGLVEMYRNEIKDAQLVASPGCYPTSILLPILPLLKENMISMQDIIADSMSGASGAGRKEERQYLFVECNESLRPYSIPKHRHLSEMEQEIERIAGRAVVMQFTPHLVPVNRGMLTTLYLSPPASHSDRNRWHDWAANLDRIYQAVFGAEPFVRLLGDRDLPDTKNVVGTNVIEIGWRLDPRSGRMIVVSALDNLLKGAGGQAIQSLNLLLGLPEIAGLI